MSGIVMAELRWGYVLRVVAQYDIDYDGWNNRYRKVFWWKPVFISVGDILRVEVEDTCGYINVSPENGGVLNPLYIVRIVQCNNSGVESRFEIGYDDIADRDLVVRLIGEAKSDLCSRMSNGAVSMFDGSRVGQEG